MIRKMVCFWTLLILAILLLIPIMPVFSSDVDEADFYGIITISNNGTMASGVSVNVTGANTTAFIAGGWLNSSANNCAIQNSAGADAPFMPGYGNNPWIIYTGSLGANSITNNILYMKDVTGGDIVYFPGSTGGTVNDTMPEPGNDFEWRFNSYRIKDGTALLRKDGAYSLLYTGGLLTGTIFSSVSQNFTTYTEQDVGGYISETASTVTAVNCPSTADCYLHKDFGVGFFNSISTTFSITINGDAVNPLGLGGIAFTNTLDDRSGFAATDIWVQGQPRTGTVALITLGRGNPVTSDNSVNLTAGATYYCTLEKVNGNDNATCYIYSDSGYSALVDTLTIAGAGAATTWRYAMGFVNYNSGVANRNFSGTISNMAFNTNLASTLVAISEDERDIELSLSGGVFSVDADGTSNTTAYAGSVPNSTSNTYLCADAIYVESIEYEQGGAYVDGWVWEYGATFTGNVTGNILTPSFRTASSDADVSARLTLFAPTDEPEAPAFAVGGGPDFMDTSNVTTANFTTGNTTLNFPGKEIIEDVSEAGGVPYQIPSTYISMSVLIIISMVASYFLKTSAAPSLFAKSVINVGIIGVLIALQIFDWWMLIFYFIFEQAIWFGAKHRTE